jgi:hypothetical protein
MEILRRGSEGEAVRKWQNFLLGLGLYTAGVDGIFGPLTEAATRAFQQKHRLARDAMVGPMTYGAALQAGFDPGLTDPLGGTSGPDWPPPPAFAPLVSNLERERIFGKFRYQRIAPGRDDIRMLGDWERRNLVKITLPQLTRVKGAPARGTIRVHRLVTAQWQALFDAWQRDGLLPLLKTWDGGFVPRFIRGSSTTLSNHAWGTAFDINCQWNLRGHLPALRSETGSVRELVPRAQQFGFYWGGHFSRRDGMHFEVARVLG